MKKLTLKLDELRVDSFDTESVAPTTRGTVEGRDSLNGTCGASCYTCQVSCNNMSCFTCNGTCEMSVCYGGSCWGTCNTCQGSCYGTCVATCGETCTCGAYCV
ncbi:hypothetical protein [Longimicrobium sp.]|uniref:hypothetical protein n=1 Tax=Longimicrobium sp. TaxID=2029185 RepID=UPI002E304A38|nr:hypothetical protein [Longimicrobium sp.]HEX6041904.1 hypothetical protein [Longimicrobium sp.]